MYRGYSFFLNHLRIHKKVNGLVFIPPHEYFISMCQNERIFDDFKVMRNQKFSVEGRRNFIQKKYLILLSHLTDRISSKRFRQILQNFLLK